MKFWNHKENKAPRLKEESVALRALRLEGLGVGEAITWLKESGYSKGESVIVLSYAYDIPLAVATAHVHESSTWADRKAADDELQEQFWEVVLADPRATVVSDDGTAVQVSINLMEDVSPELTVTTMFVVRLPFGRNVLEQHRREKYGEIFPYLLIEELVQLGNEYILKQRLMDDREFEERVYSGFAEAVEESLGSEDESALNLIYVGFFEASDQLLDHERFVSHLGPLGKRVYEEYRAHRPWPK